MEQYNAFINSLGHRFLVGGDFSAKYQYWDSPLINPIGRGLYQATQEKQLEMLSTGEKLIGQQISRKLQIYYTFLF
jgi:hypothetical protein